MENCQTCTSTACMCKVSGKLCTSLLSFSTPELTAVKFDNTLVVEEFSDKEFCNNPETLWPIARKYWDNFLDYYIEARALGKIYHKENRRFRYTQRTSQDQLLFEGNI